MTISIQCPAKLNLFLNIIGASNTGFHNLESIFIKINLFDELEVSKSNNFSLKISGEFAQYLSDSDNNLIKIFSYFKENFQINSEISILLKKNIPIGAGLGGGSSNGACFIKALNQIFALNLSKSHMQKIALNFGSDLPFFFEDDICFVEGRGEIIAKLSDLSNNFANKFKLDLSKSEIILINPKIHLSTKEIFTKYSQKIFQQKLGYTPKIDKNELINLSFANILKNYGNDLEKIAIDNIPELSEILNNLQKFSPISAKMTGSGSSLFAIFDDNNKSQKCFDYFNTNHPYYFIKKNIF